MTNVPTFEAVTAVIDALKMQGLIWDALHGVCQECHSVDGVYETHRDLIDAARQVLVCRSCLTAAALRPTDEW
jgi:hypothetical protein